MPRTAKGVHSTYPQKNMIDAVEAVRQGLSVRKAAQKFGVPKSTLGDRIAGHIAPDARPGKQPTIPLEVESKLVEKAVSLAEQGFGISKRQLTARAGQLCRTAGIRNKFTNGIPGKSWWSGLKSRHPELTLRKPERLSTVRSKGMNPTVVGSYFADLHGLVHDMSPSSIWNMDETSVSLQHSPSSVVARKGSKVIPGRTSNSRETVTMLPCINAAGQKMPPIIVVKGKTPKSLRSYNTHEGPSGALWGFQKSAWMDDDLGVTWFRDVFLKNCGDTRPQILIMDNHRSHETLGLLESAAANDIIVFAFPPHTTHYLCPLDRTVFGPFQRSYGAICSDFMSQKASALVTKVTFPKLLTQAYDKAFTRANIVAGFESTGICEWNPLSIPPQAFAPSKPFDKYKEAVVSSDQHPLQWVINKIMKVHKESTSNIENPISSQPEQLPLMLETPTVESTMLEPNCAPMVIDDISLVVEIPPDNSGEKTNSMVFVPDILGEDGDSVGTLNIIPFNTTQTPSWSTLWNAEIESMFEVSEDTAEVKTSQKITSHRLLTSEDILKCKREEKDKKDRQEKEKEQRKLKREISKKIKLEKQQKHAKNKVTKIDNNNLL